MSSQLILMDGGIGHLLKEKGLDKFSESLAFNELFAAGSLANILRPDIVRRVHEDYSQCCNVNTSNTFGCTKFSLGKIGKADQAIELAVAAAKIANDVAKASGKPILVAGSLPPLQESYQVYTQHNTTAEQLKEFEEEYIALAMAIAPFVDILLFETLSSITEALLASRAAHTVHKTHPTKPWWISFTLEDSERAVLRSGEPLEQAAQIVVENFPENNLEAILINCCAPAAVTAGLRVLNRVATIKDKGIKIGGYANGFKTTTSEWLESEATANTSTASISASLLESSSLPSTTSSNDKTEQRKRGTQLLTLPDEEYNAQGIIIPEAYLKHARHWRRSQECGGASIIGGCCGVGPEHIALLGSQLL